MLYGGCMAAHPDPHLSMRASTREQLPGEGTVDTANSTSRTSSSCDRNGSRTDVRTPGVRVTRCRRPSICQHIHGHPSRGNALALRHDHGGQSQRTSHSPR